MAVDFCKHHKGDVVRVHCCDDCARRSGVQPKSPPDSGVESWLCEVCGHFGIGSATDCTIGDWLRLQPNAVLNALTGICWHDVSQVVEIRATKCYAEGGDTPCGVTVTVMTAPWRTTA